MTTMTPWHHPKRHERSPGPSFTFGLAIERLLKARGLTLQAYQSMPGRSMAWACETDKGRRWVTRRGGKWETHREEPAA